MDFVAESLAGNTGGTVTIDPNVIPIKTPTTGPDCGSRAGAMAHAERGERNCDGCREAANEARAAWEARHDAEIDAERKARAALLRPSLTAILESAGIWEPASLITEMARHGYGDYADALEKAADQCPVGVERHATGGGIRAWLRGRAGLIKKTL